MTAKRMLIGVAVVAVVVILIGVFSPMLWHFFLVLHGKG